MITCSNDKIDKVRKVLHLTLSMKAGGLERVINQLAQKTDKTLFKVYIGCLVEGGAFLEGLDRYGIESIIFGKEPVAIDIKLIKKIIDFIRENKIDIIHSHSGTMIYAAITGRLGRVKGIIHTDHGRHFPEQWKVVWEERISSIFIDKVVGVSKSLTEYLKKRVKIRPRKLTTIINGVDTSTFSTDSIDGLSAIKKELGITKGDKVIGTVCRFTAGKNLPILMKTVSEIKKKVSNIKLVLAGDGEEMDNLKRLSQTLGIEKTTIFTGWRNDMEKILKTFNIFVLPSLSEGTSMTILEAMSTGIPVIASDVGGNPGLIEHGKNGFLFPIDKPEMLTNCLIELLQNEKSARNIGKEARKTAERHYSLTYMTKAYEELYLELRS